MKILIAFVIMASTAMAGTHKSMIACQLAASTMSKTVPSEKVPRSQCDICGGTGKVKAGDGSTLVWRACDHCYDDKIAKMSSYILMFTASWCDPCNKMKGSLKPDPNPNSPPLCWLMTTGWQVGPAGHIRLIDVDERPDLKNQYQVKHLPTLVLIQNGREVRRQSGYMTAHQIANLYNNKSKPSKSVTRRTGNHWSWPGDLRSHLITTHKLPKDQVMNASPEQLQQWHDSLHMQGARR